MVVDATSRDHSDARYKGVPSPENLSDLSHRQPLGWHPPLHLLVELRSGHGLLTPAAAFQGCPGSIGITVRNLSVSGKQRPCWHNDAAERPPPHYI